jgi:ABC-type lipoprotein export system ATPase subunit
MFELINTTKSYSRGLPEERVIIDQASWKIEPGDFIGLVGRSGSGKTTVLNILGGLLRPDAGTVTIAGHDLSQMDDRALADFRNRTIGFVFQHFFLRPRRTAVDNVIVPLLFGSQMPGNLRSRALETLDLVGLADYADKPVGNLSGGQRQRVAIARALITRPSLILADEPTGNLDVDTGTALFELLRQYQRDFGTTIVVVTHDPLVERLHLPLFTVANRQVLPVPEGTGLAHLDTIPMGLTA